MAEKHKKGYVATLPVHFVPFASFVSVFPSWCFRHLRQCPTTRNMIVSAEWCYGYGQFPGPIATEGEACCAAGSAHCSPCSSLWAKPR